MLRVSSERNSVYVASHHDLGNLTKSSDSMPKLWYGIRRLKEKDLTYDVMDSVGLAKAFCRKYF